MLDLIKPKILIFIIVAILTSVAITVYIMRNVYKPKASAYCAASISSINYRETCTAYYYADYTCSNGVTGKVGNGTCQLYTSLYDQAKKACCEGPVPSLPVISPTPTPFRPSVPPPTSYQPTPTLYLKPCPYVCRDKCLTGEIYIEGYNCPSMTRPNCCASSATPQPITIFPTAIPITAILTKTPTSQLSPIPITQQVPTKTPIPLQCLSKYARCTRNSECCSGLCVSRMCR